MVNKEKTQDGIKQEYNWISVVGERRDRAETESESVCLQKSDGRIAKLSSCMRCEIAGIVCGSIYRPRTYLGVYRRFMDRKLFQNNKCARTAAMGSHLRWADTA